MIHTLRIGIREKTSEKEKIVTEVFISVKELIKNKKEFLYNIQLEDYENLKNEFELGAIDSFEKDNYKSMCQSEKKIIVFNNSFFDCSEINQKSVFIHEIGHIINQPLNSTNVYHTYLARYLHGEYLADFYLFNIDKDIFLNGRIIPDLNIISIEKIKKEVEQSDDKDTIIKSKFSIIGRLYYYYSLCEYQPIISKIDELITLIKEYFPNCDSILNDIKGVCNKLKLEEYQKLKDSLDKIGWEIGSLRRS